MKKLVIILSSFLFLLLLCILVTFKTIYIYDSSSSSFEVYSDKNIISEKINVKAQYCSLFKIRCADINDVDISNNINFDKIGEYNIVYKFKYKNRKKTYVKKINIVDTTAPTIKLSESKLMCPNKYVEPGYEVSDNYDTDIKNKVKIEKINNTLIYTVIDSSGNKTIAKRDLTFGDKEAPKITLKGNETIYLLIGEEYKEPGYEVSDNCDDDLKTKVQIESNLNNKVTGTYTIKYSVSDSSGNKVSQTRFIKVYNTQSNITIIPTNKVIYLTFDDGPGPYTEYLLDILKKYNVKATFFVTNQFSKYQYVLKRIDNEGHTIAIHSYSHSYKNIYSSVDAFFNDIDKMDKIIYSQTEKHSKLLRFPGGSSNTISRFNKGIMTSLSKETAIRGYKYFDWNVDSNDTGTSNSNKISNNIIKGIKANNYSIVLQHDIKKYSVNAVEDVIKYGLANGYTFLPLDITSPTAHHGINN